MEKVISKLQENEYRKCKTMSHICEVESKLGQNKTEHSSTSEVFLNATKILKEKREEEKLHLEDRCLKWLKKWSDDWKKDLDLRPPDIAKSPRGRDAEDEHKTTMKSLSYLFEQLKNRSLPEPVKKGIWLVVQAMIDRNYIHANAVLLNAIAIGNSPWPIGVTQVGIHTKSAAREKISASHMNKNASAHVMGDEASRKYLQGLKRLISVVQRLFPTSPSWSVEFCDEVDISRGFHGSDSLKHKLSCAEQRGEMFTPLQKRSFLSYENDTTVKVPRRLFHILKEADCDVD